MTLKINKFINEKSMKKSMKKEIGKMQIVKNLNCYSFFNEVQILSELEVKNYRIDFSEFSGLFLVDEDNFTLPEKIYDVDKEFRELVLKSFNMNTRNTGVLLDGEKGFGKSVMAKQLAIQANLPVIMITKSIPVKYDFLAFLNNIKQEFVLFIDEFEKIFPNGNSHLDDDDDNKKNSPSQHVFLSYLDGSTSNEFKKLVLLTTNTPIDDKFINRPSRIKFYKEYVSMSEDMYDMIIENKLINKEYKNDLLENLPLIECSPDLLTSIIDEINKLEMPYSKFKEYFNHKQQQYRYNIYKQVEKDGIVTYEYFYTSVNSSPITKNTKYINNFYDMVIQSYSKDGSEIIFSGYSNYNYNENKEINSSLNLEAKTKQIWKAKKDVLRLTF